MAAAHDSLSSVRAAYRFVGLVAGLVVAIAAQFAIEQKQLELGAAGYVVAAVLVALSAPGVTGAVRRARQQSEYKPGAIRVALAAGAVTTSAATFALSGGNRYTILGVMMWVISVVCWWGVFAETGRGVSGVSSWLREIRSRLMRDRADAAALILLVSILLLGAVFLFANLYGNPLEMNSDHAEKLLEINDVLNGKPYIFFEQNTGREPWQFWWTVLLIRLFNLPLDFMALKIGTSLIGWLALPGIFLLGREVFGTRVALMATLLAAVASWGVLLARYGLRFPLLYCATAWTLYFLVRGLRRDQRNSLLAAGVAMGIGLQGYTSFRAMPVVCLLIVGMWAGWLFVRRDRQAAKRALVGTGMALVLAAAVCMPLIRYGVDYPDKLLYRVATRISGLEQPLQGSVPEVLLNNAKNALLMFNYTGDEVWVENLPYKPAMDPVLGALLVVGAAAAIAVSVKRRDPWPAAVLAAGLLMLGPSAVNIAFPRENPSVGRAAGALPMLIIMCALVPGMLLDITRRYRLMLARIVTPVVIVGLSGATIALNYDRVFVQYPAVYCESAQNASDIAREIRAFYDAGNPRSNAWIGSYPHWIDHRLVGIWLGDVAFSNVAEEHGMQVSLGGEAGLFVLNVGDKETLSALSVRYPEGVARTVSGQQCPNRQFVLFSVPPE
jgi:hypothetical protein